MIERALEFITEYDIVIDQQIKYLKENNWSEKLDRKEKQEEYSLHLKITRTLLAKIDYVTTEIGVESLKDHKKAVTFIKKLSLCIHDFVKRIDGYLKSEKWQQYEITDDKANEMDFQDNLLTEMLYIKKLILKNIVDENNKDFKVKTFGNVVLPFPMRKILESRFPEMKEMLENPK